MARDTTMAWGHGRELSGRVHTLAVGSVAALKHGRIKVPSAIHKTPVTGPVMLTANGLAGDEQADSNVHGGPDKAVCVYPWEHYSYWALEYGLTLGDAAFGENLTSIGLVESEIYVGDILEWGQATVQVSQPRRPCFKIGARHGRPGLAAEVEHTRRTGFYFRVLRSGKVSADDHLRLVDVDPFALSVADLTAVMTDGAAVAGLSIERVLLARHLLPPRWVSKLERLASAESLDADLERLGGTAG